MNEHITYLIFASFNKYINDLHQQSTYFAAFLLDLLSNNKCFKMYASANQVSKWIENKFPIIFNNLIAVEKHRVVNYHFDIPSMSWKDFVAPLRALSPKALHCSGSWKMSPVLIQSGLGTMLGPPQHKVFSFWNITVLVSWAEFFSSTYDGLLHADLVSPEVDRLGCDVLPLPGVENSVYNADEVTSVAIANVNVTETLNGI